MTPLPPPSALRLSRGLVRALVRINALVGMLIVALVVTSVVAPAWTMQALRVPTDAEHTALFPRMRFIMLARVFEIGTHMRADLDGTV